MSTGSDDPTKWVDDWPISGLSSNHRKQIRVELLKAQVAFRRANPHDTYRYMGPMRMAFDGVARVLFEAQVLTEDVMRNELGLLILESAIAGNWWYAPNDKREEIFPSHFGHREEWEKLLRNLPELFAAEFADWQSKILEREIAEGSSTPALSSLHIESGKGAKILGRKAVDAVHAAMPQTSATKQNRGQRLDRRKVSKDKGNIALLRDGGTYKRSVMVKTASQFGGVGKRAIEKAAQKGTLETEGKGPNRRILVKSLLEYFPPETNAN
jgi:hypothetical protein